MQKKYTLEEISEMLSTADNNFILTLGKVDTSEPKVGDKMKPDDGRTRIALFLVQTFGKEMKMNWKLTDKDLTEIYNDILVTIYEKAKQK